MNIAEFTVNQDQFTGCGKCVKARRTALLPESVEVRQRVLRSLIANRHSCRRYLNKNVDKQIIEDMLNSLANAPNGGNKQQVAFTLIDDKDQMQQFRETAYEEMERLAKKGIYPAGFDRTSYMQMNCFVLLPGLAPERVSSFV